MNSKTLPGAECGTDHHLLTAKFKPRLKVSKQKHKGERGKAYIIPRHFKNKGVNTNEEQNHLKHLNHTIQSKTM